MDFLYLSPEFPPNYRNFIIELNRLGVRVWGMGEADFYQMPEDLRNALQWYVPCNLKDIPCIESAIRHLTHDVMLKKGVKKIDLIESHNEYWMGVEAFLNEKLNVEGIRPNDLGPLKRKSVMKQLFQKNGILTAKGGLIKTAEDALQLAKTLPTPLILKPDIGVGAEGVFKVRNESELSEATRYISSNYILEEFIEAPIVTYDGLTDKTGEVIFENSLVYGCGVLENVLGEDTFFYVTREIPEDLRKLGTRIVKLAGIKRKFFHLEFFKTPQGYVPIEVNARPPGGAIIDMMNYSMDGDLYRAYAEMIVSGKTTLPLGKKYFCCYVGRKDKRYKNSHAEIFSRYKEHIVEIGENPKLFWNGMGKFRYILRMETEKELIEAKNHILEIEGNPA